MVRSSFEQSQVLTSHLERTIAKQVNSNGPKMLFLPILEVLNFDFSKFEYNSKFRVSKIGKNNIFGPFELAKTVLHVSKIKVALK